MGDGATNGTQGANAGANAASGTNSTTVDTGGSEDVAKLREQLAALTTEKEKVAAALAKTNDEAKKKREAADSAERARLEAEGKYQDLYTRTRTEIDDLKPKASRADALEGVLRRNLDARIAKLPEHMREKYRAMDPVVAFDVIDDVLAAVVPVAPAAPPTQQPQKGATVAPTSIPAAGLPAPVATPTAGPDVNTMSPEQLRTYLDGLSPKELREFAQKRGIATEKRGFIPNFFQPKGG